MILTICIWTILVLFTLIILGSSFFTVKQQTAKIVERLGKFKSINHAGFHFKIPLIDQICGTVNLRTIQLDVEVETKTKDDVFVKVLISIQYYIMNDKIYDAFYKLNDPSRQIKSYVFDVVRATVPNIKLDDVFQKKDDIANAIKTELSQAMDDFGYEIIKSLVTDIDPDPKVKNAMNEINAATRLRIAANEKGEADKILQIKKAEAEAKSKELQGMGIANQRKAIVDGLKESVSDFQSGVPGSTPNDVMNLVLMTQYFDTLKELGMSSQTNTILIPHSPGILNDISSQIRNAIISANEIK